MRRGAGNQAAGDRTQTVPLLPVSQSVRKKLPPITELWEAAAAARTPRHATEALH